MLRSVFGILTAMAFVLMPVAHATEEPRYSIVDKIGAIEVRQYAPRLAADVIVPGDEEDARNAGFRLLADYIFGNNTARTKIAMTAPVAQERSEKIDMTAPVAQTREGGGWRVRFFMPAKYTRETLPKPNNPAVQIVEVPAETMAVLRFSNTERGGRRGAHRRASGCRGGFALGGQWYAGVVVLRPAVDAAVLPAERGCRAGGDATVLVPARSICTR